MPSRLTERLRRGLGGGFSGSDPSPQLLPPLRGPVRETVPPAATGALASLRQLGERWAGPVTIVAALALGVIWLAAHMALEHQPSLPPLRPAPVAPGTTAIGGHAQGLHSDPQPPARIAAERRQVRHRHGRRRPRPAAAAARPRATAPPAVTATPSPVVSSPTPTAAPQPVRPTPAPAPARPEPRRPAPDQTFDSSG